MPPRASKHSITKSAPTTATAGTDIPYTLTVTNVGPSTSSGVTVAYVLPAQLTFVSSFSQGTTTADTYTLSLHDALPISTQPFTITVHINPAATGPIVNTATVAATNATEDTNAANNFSTATTARQRVAYLNILKTAPLSATTGTNITYTLTVTNNGPSTSSD